MKKNILKLLITISLIFSFAPVSKAVFNNSICTTINKTSCARSNGLIQLLVFVLQLGMGNFITCIKETLIIESKQN